MIWEEVIRCQKYGTCEISVGGQTYKPGSKVWGERLYQVLETVAYSRQIALEVLDGSDKQILRKLVSAPVIHREKLAAKARGETYALRGEAGMRQLLGQVGLPG